MRLMSGGPGRTHRAAVDEDGSLLLALEPGNERLPWLEGEENDEDEEPQLDRGRVAVVALALLLLLAVLAGVAWWLWQGRNETTLLADGSVIEAPDGPYKVRPRDPGGREVADPNATSFRLGEGEHVEGRLAPEPNAVQPAGGEAGAVEATLGAATTGVGVQIGAYPTREAAQAAWAQLSTRLPPLNGRGHRIVEGTVDVGPVFRLQVVAGSVAEANALCTELRGAGGDCQVKR